MKLCTMMDRKTKGLNIVYYDEHGQLVVYNDREGHGVADHAWVSNHLRHTDAPEFVAGYLKGAGIDPVIVKRLSREMNQND